MTPLSDTSRCVDITFRSSGEIIISARVANRLELKKGDTINVFSDNGEYLLVANHVRRDSDGKPVGRFRHSVSYYKGEKGTMRCNDRTLCSNINFVCGSTEAKLFCGVPKPNYRGHNIALPLITINNQSKQ